eukprot:CAMPEP_0197075042 /NCGR_PEP_ID=MMETSP1384-20130603/211413_1 /TAXON_ID=29189 /ORGANISM="Ammonia sp." /LENGTH=436 /DNA_ID=CAMNT_0042513885 /DNA_START=26 /DNA_END=1334 /DNA_ORIENTATION=+
MWTLAVSITALFTVTSGGAAVTYTDWQAAKSALQSAKTHWQSNGLTSYAYSWSDSCFCEYCYIAAKYIVISDRSSTDPGTPTYVEFDAEALAQNTWQTCSTMDYIQSPLNNTYHSIDYYFDQALAWTQRGIDNCGASSSHSDTNFFADFVCNGSITFAYDDTLFYPTQISLTAGPQVADAGNTWTFRCLTPLTAHSSTDLSAYDGQCLLSDGSAWSVPSIGDECGSPGTDCAALRCACVTCENGGEWGCCSTCTVQENALGELMCSGMIPQSTVCAETTTPSPETTRNYTFCGGFAGLSCPDGQICIDDPRDDCDPDHGGADLEEFVLMTASRQPDGQICIDDPRDDCDPDHGGADCGGICVDDGITTTSTGCICTLQYDPYCCDDTTYGNACVAECEGFTVDADCAEGECDDVCCGGGSGATPNCIFVAVLFMFV